MKQAIHIFAFSLFFLFAVSAAVNAQDSSWNNITGTVVDEQEIPVEGAQVCARGTGPISGALPCAKSKRDGRFDIFVYRADTYTILAKNFEKGYPDTSWAFYGKSWDQFPRVIVRESVRPDPVKVKLGPKAGRLVLTILDGDGDKYVESGSITVCRVNESKSCVTMITAFPNGHYELLTPEVDFTIKFQTWHGEWVARNAFDNDSGLPVEVLRVELGSRNEMTIRLK